MDPDLDAERWARAKGLFQEALERDPAARPTFLEERCAGDAPLMRDVESLLEASDEAGAFLESSAGVDRIAAEVLGFESPRALAAGSRLGPYEVLDLLEAGGMGEVYRARDERLGRDVAIKVLRAHHSGDPRGRQRLEREARAVAALSDPNIVTVFDVGWDLGQPYLVSELLEGETLGRRLRTGRLGLLESVECAAQIARGLAAAHEKGIVHRDLKPDNVFLTRQGPVKLLDFGVAKLVLGLPGPEGPAPPPGGAKGSTLMGTPGYMAPEQLEGHADHRSDIFALGAVLYRMLTGRSAFADEGTAESPDATSTEAPRPFTAVDAVPTTLQRVVSRCLEKRPEDRFQSVGEVRLALKAFSDAQGALARRRRGLGAGATAAALAGILLVGTVPQRSSRVAVSLTRPIHSLAVLPFENASGASWEDYFVDGMTDAVIAEISHANLRGLRLISRSSAMEFKERKVRLPEVARQLGVDTVVQGTVGRAGRHVRLAVRLVGVPGGDPLWARTDEGPLEEVASLQHRIATALMAEIAPAVDLDRDHPQRRGPQTVEAYEAYLRGRYYWNTRSEESIHKAIDHFNRALELDPLYAPAYTGLADALATLGDMLYLMPSKDAFAKAEAASLRALQMDPSQAEAHATLGHLRMHAWRWEDAEREFQQAIAIDPGYASAHHWRAFNLASVGRLDEAVASIETAQRLDPLSLIINADVAQVLYFARRYDEAIAQSRKTLQMNADFQEARRILFLSLQRMHHDQEALKELEAFYRSPDGGPGASTGYAFAMLGRRARARAVLGQQDSHSERQFVPPYNLAVIHVGLGDVDRAFALLDESVTRNDTESMILPVDPRLDALRRDPRYAALLRRMGLPRS